jgi:NADH:ubiquinone oxidoreductase subunit 3 (subunit A)
MTIPNYIWYWIFILLFFLSGLIIPVIALILQGRRRGDVKEDTFECGQEIDVRPGDLRILGAIRYFAYAIPFFVLDALAWILIAGVSIFNFNLSPLPLIIYVVVVFVGIYYFVRVIEGGG